MAPDLGPILACASWVRFPCHGCVAMWTWAFFLCLSGGSGRVLAQLSSQVEPCRTARPLPSALHWAHPIQYPCLSYLLALPGSRGGGEPSLSLGLLQYLLHSRTPRNGSLEPSGQKIPTSLCRLAWSHHTMPFQPVSERHCRPPACFSPQPSLPGSLSFRK